MSNIKILYVTSEMDPFFSEGIIGKTVRNIAKELRSNDAEVRIVIPKFGLINDRRNRLHEVVRLSNISVKIGGDIKPIRVKVASIREERLQVYFLDSDEYFKRKFVFHDANGKFFDDNSERLLYFTRATFETLKNVNWIPNVIHCHGWISSLIPLYLKNGNDKTFKDAKCISTLYQQMFPESFSDEIFNLSPLLQKEKQTLIPEGIVNYQSLINLASKYSELTTYTSDSSLDTENMRKSYEILDSIKGLQKIDYNETDMISKYCNIYNDILQAVEVS